MANLHPPVGNKDHIHGNKNALLELVEYGDFQCPHCGRAYPILKRIKEVLGQDLKFVFRNFPLTNVHPNAFAAAVAAEAAGIQHKFWEMHDVIFEHQNTLDAEHLFLFAKHIGLDLEQFRNDIQKQELGQKVENDFESGLRSGVNGTPSFFINGEKYEGSWAEKDLLARLENLLLQTGA